jgi:hypothetical protein
MKKVSLLVLFLPLCMFLMGADGCDPATDPTKADLEKGQSIDLERMEGEVVKLEVQYFKGDQEGVTKDKGGKPFYVVTIRRDGGSSEEFKGVPKDKFDLIKVGTRLPLGRCFTIDDLGKVEGKIIDKVALAPYFYLVILQNGQPVLFRVTIEAYYDERIRVGEVLRLR